MNSSDPINSTAHWTIYRTRFLVRARQLTEPLAFIDVLGREQSGQPGDYLVESSDGMRRITSRTLFEDIYIPLEPLPGTNSGRELGVVPRPRSAPEHRPRANA